jgi:hypothetical protein
MSNHFAKDAKDDWIVQPTKEIADGCGEAELLRSAVEPEPSMIGEGGKILPFTVSNGSRVGGYVQFRELFAVGSFQE